MLHDFFFLFDFVLLCLYRLLEALINTRYKLEQNDKHVVDFFKS